MRYRAKVDNNQNKIVEILRKRGFEVKPTHQMGGGFPDLVVSTSKEIWLAEVKNPAEKKGKRYTPAQEEFYKNWKGKPVKHLVTEEDALSFPNCRDVII